MARATAEYTKYAEGDREGLAISFPRIWRIPRFNRGDVCQRSVVPWSGWKKMKDHDKPRSLFSSLPPVNLNSEGAKTRSQTTNQH
jgi:hypothetical protein